MNLPEKKPIHNLDKGIYVAFAYHGLSHAFIRKRIA